MSSVDLNLVYELFMEARARHGSERARLLDERCIANPNLRSEVESLLRHDDDPGPSAGFIETAAVPGGLSSMLEQVAAEQSDLPETIGQYRIIRLIGEGGMGTVYEARQQHPQRRVALKVLRSDMAPRGMLKRFEQESQLLARLQHVGIAQVYESGTYGPADRPSKVRPFFAMEFVEGAPISEYCRKPGCSTHDVVNLVALVADAVEHAHLRGVIHRDLKPANILVTVDGQPKVLDFGVARALEHDVQLTSMRTDVGQLIGTLAYMSPEQITGSANAGIDQRCDVYSVGVVLYELLTGRLPHEVRGSSIAHAAQRITREEPARMSSIRRDLRGDLDTIVRKTLEKEPARRYQSAAALATDLRHYLRNEPIAARPATTMYQFRKFAQRNKALVAGVTLAALALAAGATASTIMAISENHLRHEAELSKAAAQASDTAARRSEAASQRNSYRLALAAADAVSQSDPVKAISHLESAPENLRGWEWRYVRSRLHPSHVVAQSDHSSDGCAIALSPEGEPLAAITRDGKVELINITTKKLVAACASPDTNYQLAKPQLAADASVIAALETLPPTSQPPTPPPVTPRPVILFDADGRERWRSPVAASAFRLSPDGRELALESAGRIHLYHAGDSAPVIDIPAGDPNFPESWIAFSFGKTSAEFMIHRGGKEEFLTFDARTGKQQSATHSGNNLSVTAQLGAERIAIAIQRRIELREANTDQPALTLQGHMDFISAISPSPDLSRLASAALDHTIRIWNLDTGACETAIAVDSVATALRWLPDAQHILSTDSDGRVNLVSITAESAPVLRGHHSYVYHALFSPDGQYIASAGWKDEVKLWEAASGRLIATLTESDRLDANAPAIVGFSRSGSDLIVAPWAKAALRWNLDAIARGETTPETLADPSSPRFPLDILRWPAHQVRRDGGQWLAVSADGTLIAHADNREIRILEASTAVPVRTLHPATELMRCIEFSPDGASLAIGCEDAKVHLIDSQTGAIQRTFIGHRAQVYCVGFSPDGSRLASGGNDNAIIIWDPRFNDPLLEIRGHAAYVHAVSFSPDGEKLVSASGDGTVRIWVARPSSATGNSPSGQ